MEASLPGGLILGDPPEEGVEPVEPEVEEPTEPGENGETVEPDAEPFVPSEGEDDPEGSADEPDERPEIDVTLDADWPFEVDLLELDDLLVDHRYQRPVQERFVKQMVAEFDETLVGCLDVSERGNGTYAILDGQQRFEAMKVVGKTTCFASTFTGLSIEDEAGFFYRKNKDRRAMAGYFGFRARVMGGDATAVQIDDAVSAVGYVLGEKTDHVDVIGAVSAVERAWALTPQKRAEALTPALRTIREAWHGRKDSLDGRTIGGLARFWKAFSDEEVDHDALLRGLEEIGSPRNLIGMGKERAGASEALMTSMAKSVVWAYNRSSPERALDAETVTAR